MLNKDQKARSIMQEGPVQSHFSHANSGAGFAVLFAALVGGLALAIGLAIFNISFREVILSTQARDSQKAFFAADAAMECALYWDREHPVRPEGSVFGYIVADDIEANHLTTGALPGFDEDSHDTASISPEGNALVLAWVASTRYANQGGNPSQPTLTGNNLNWVPVDSILYDSDSSGYAPRNRITLFRAMGGSPTPNQKVTITFPENQNEFVWSIVEYTNVDTSGTDGSGALAQVDSVATGITPVTASLSGFQTKDRPTMGVSVGNLSTIFPEAGYTKFAQAGDGSGSTRISIMSEWKADGEDGTPSATWSPVAQERAGAIAARIKAAGQNFIPPIGQDTDTLLCAGANINDPATGWRVTGWEIEPASIVDQATTTFDIDFGDGTCAEVKVGKSLAAGTIIESRGYNTCETNDMRRVERGLRTTY